MDIEHHLIVVGYAKVPATSASRAAHEYLAVSLRIDRRTGRVVQVDSTAVTGLVRDWIAELLLDRDLAADIQPIVEQIDRCYLGHGAGPIKQAIVDACRRYATHRKEDAS
ncbi:uncharacterized protein DUF3870 [Kribbella sp. VKM Ac-2571]|uniref:DUF3870 domain-containing protein n=1 Tax=Kribbella sp. VKM Ac-2571 TaxID=2512222 RepID=UPI0010D52651|nr:DUF3870 domain-containing protein [Kribbella sp. VKM Ac-2571]TDO66506.1 uncharacterized protein DUF3870 [Kribbella sp. VKM Ac-2571]